MRFPICFTFLLAALALAPGARADAASTDAAAAAAMPAGDAEQGAGPPAAEPERRPEPEPVSSAALAARVKALEAQVATLQGLVARLAEGHHVVGAKHVLQSGSARIEVSPMGILITSPGGVRIAGGGGVDIDSRAGMTVAASRGLDLKGSSIKLNGGAHRVLRGQVRIRNTCIPDRSTGSFRCAEGIVEPNSYSRSVFTD